MKQSIILVTGHICSGKSILYQYLNKEFVKVDIARIHKKTENLFKPTEQFNNQEPRLYYLVQEIVNNLFNQNSVYIEILGIESWFQIFKNTLKKLWVPLIQIELQRESIQLAKTCLEQRCSKYKDPEEYNSVFEIEHQGIQETYYQIFNPEAKKFMTNNTNCKDIAKYILNEKNN